MRVVNVEEEDGLGAVKPELHVFHLVVHKGAQDGVLEGHASQFGVVVLGQLCKADSAWYLAAFVGVFYDDFDSVHDKIRVKICCK